MNAALEITFGAEETKAMPRVLAQVRVCGPCKAFDIRGAVTGTPAGHGRGDEGLWWTRRSTQPIWPSVP